MFSSPFSPAPRIARHCILQCVIAVQHVDVKESLSFVKPPSSIGEINSPYMCAITRCKILLLLLLLLFTISFTIESYDNLGWKRPQEVCGSTSCSKQGQLWDEDYVAQGLSCAFFQVDTPIHFLCLLFFLSFHSIKVPSYFLHLS